MKRNLYLVTVRRGRSCYVLATDPTAAQKEVESLLNKADWYFSHDREVIEIKLLAPELGEYSNGRPDFGDNMNCFIEVK